MSKATQVHHLFQTIAGNYDQMNNVISLGTHQSWRTKATSFMNLRPNYHVLDLCCGTGDWTIKLGQSLGRHGSVTGLDFSENMLNIARKKISQHDFKSSVKLMQGDAMHLPFADNQFDAVSIGFGLRNVSDRMQTLNEIYRVLKPGGQLTCLETSQPTTPVIRQGWELYFGHLVPLLGKVLVDEESEYTYLTQSTNTFVTPRQLASMFHKAGFKAVSYQKLLFGSATIHIGTKKES